ncbi:RpiB/LacA/LacB family sugar-phosphate isomerase [Candidatus Saccharibacteria bacterium]|nr:RpiB/LacA/LacB family sugar-phosphate isomerase [Candidatus Saccharibacteria bacterium]
MKVYLGADYRGLERKNQLKDYLLSNGYDVIDDGAYEYVEGDDFNDPAIKVARDVREDLGTMGILICDSAHGVTMQANRFKGIRAAHCDSKESASLAREHDDANVLCLSAHFMDEATMQKITKVFLETNFTGLERRVRRINRLDEREDYD